MNLLKFSVLRLNHTSDQLLYNLEYTILVKTRSGMKKLAELIQWKHRNSLEKTIIIVSAIILSLVLINVILNTNILLNLGMIVLALAFWPVLIGGLIFWINRNRKRRIRLLQAYEEAKEALRKNPKDSKLRYNCLQAGRAYYSSLRDGNLLTIYDEQALNNDLSTIIGTNPDE